MKNKFKQKLLVVGSVAFDSLKTPFGNVKKTLGGSATHFSLSASYFSSPSIIAVVGNDFKKENFNILKKRGTDISGVKIQNGKTFHWAGKYHFDLNTRDTLKTELGVFANFKPELNKQQQLSDFVFLGNIHPKLQLDVLNQIKKPKLIGLDTMNLWIETALPDLKKVLKKVNIFVINDSEARQLSKEHNIYKAAKKILAMLGSRWASSASAEDAHLQKTLIIKRGEYGLLLFNQNQIFHLPGIPLEDVIDPTGAGDTFAGGMFGYLAMKNSFRLNELKKACVYGSCLASFCVEQFGTKALHNLTKNQIENRAKQLHNLVKL